MCHCPRVVAERCQHPRPPPRLPPETAVAGDPSPWPRAVRCRRSPGRSRRSVRGNLPTWYSSCLALADPGPGTCRPANGSEELPGSHPCRCAGVSRSSQVSRRLQAGGSLFQRWRPAHGKAPGGSPAARHWASSHRGQASAPRAARLWGTARATSRKAFGPGERTALRPRRSRPWNPHRSPESAPGRRSYRHLCRAGSRVPAQRTPVDLALRGSEGSHYNHLHQTSTTPAQLTDRLHVHGTHQQRMGYVIVQEGTSAPGM